MISNLRAENGTDFQNNLWWWKPLWDYIGKNCHDILTSEDIEHGYSYHNHWISASKAKKIAHRLRELLDLGHTADYEMKYYRDMIPIINCNECMKYDGPTSKATVEEMVIFILKLRTFESLNDAKPGGKFSVDNVRKFVEFCDDSGGFSVSQG